LYVKTIRIKNFRNHQETQIKFEEKINILEGENAQGKSSILEAIYFLATSRSFRNSRIKDLIQIGNEGFFIHGVINDEVEDINVKVYYSNKQRKISFNNSKLTSFLSLIGKIKVLIFAAEDIELVKGDAKGRRKFLDIHLSLMSEEYFFCLKQYKKILKQRNKILKEEKRGDKKIGLLTEQIAEYGTKIVEKRKEIVRKLNVVAKSMQKKLSKDKEELEIRYLSPLKGETKQEIREGYLRKLRETFKNDLRYHTTSIGPHKDDIDFLINNKKAKNFASEGQKRSIVLSLKLAEYKVMEEATEKGAIILVDDVLNELDEERMKAFYPLLHGGKQVILTCTKNSKIWEYVNKGVRYKVREGKVEDADEIQQTKRN